MKSAVRSPAFRRKRLASRNGSASDACGLKAGLRTVTEWICIRRFRLKAGLRTDFPQEVQNNEQDDPSLVSPSHRAVVVVNNLPSLFNPTRPDIGSEQEAHTRRVDCAAS